MSQNSGASAARNAGIRIASGDILFFTDSDCVVRSDWVSVLRAAFADPSLVAASGRVIDHPPRTYAEDAYTGTTRIGPATTGGRLLVANNMACRRSILTQYGFDPAIPYYGEEDELAWRLTSDGHRIGFATEAVVDHDHPMTVRKYLRLGWLQGRGSARLWYKQGKYLGRDILPVMLGLLSLPLGFLSLWLLFVPGFFLAVQLAALVYNQYALKGKSLVTAVKVLPLEIAYYCCKVTSVNLTLARILLGFEPAIRESKQRWWENSKLKRSSGPPAPSAAGM